MTENEAIRRCDLLINGYSVSCSTNDAFKDENKGHMTFETMREFAETCKQALEEIQQCRAIGTVEEIHQKLKNMNLVIDTDRDLLNRYIAIGTIEEFKALKEKSVAKKPLDGGEVLREVCPTCGRFISEMNSPWYCPCGQKLDWSE